MDEESEAWERFETGLKDTQLIRDKIQASQFSSVAWSCLTFCDPMDCSMPGLPVYHQLLELAQTHVL